MKRVASLKTLMTNKSTRISYAMSALDRDCNSGESELATKADSVYSAMLNGTATNDIVLSYAIRHKEFLELN